MSGRGNIIQSILSTDGKTSFAILQYQFNVPPTNENSIGFSPGQESLYNITSFTDTKNLSIFRIDGK